MPQCNVIITGTGVVSSIGIGCDTYHQSLLEGRSGITSLSECFDDFPNPGDVADHPGLWIGGPIQDFDPKQFVRPRKALKVMCREIQTAFVASQLAVEDADLGNAIPANPSAVLDPSRIGTVFGSEMFYGPPEEMEGAIRDCLDDEGRFDARGFGTYAMKQIVPLWMLKYLPNMPACHVGIALQAHGPNNSLVLGDVSGPAAAIEAVSCLERGTADVMLAGATGTLINLTRMTYRNDLPLPEVLDPIHFSSRPHDPTSSGVVGGEGAATLVLETDQNATSRGAKPLARIVSYASRFIPSVGMRGVDRSNDPDDLTARGSSQAIRLAIETALKDARIAGKQVGLIVSHGMGDPARDTAERQAIETTMPGVPMVATIAAIGHTGAACGMIDLVTGVLSLAKRTLPPTLCAPGIQPPASFLRAAQPFDGDYVICLSHTSEGNATAIVLSRE